MSATPPLEPPTTEELRQALARSFDGAAADDVRIVARRPSAYQTSHALEELDVAIDGRTLAVLFKNLSRRALHDAASGVKPEFLYDPVRELVVYGDVLTQARGATAQCVAMVADAQRDRYWLFLEKVPGIELFQIGNPALWHRTARWLAQFHATTRRSMSDDVRAHLIVYDAAYYKRWLERARTFGNAAPKTISLAEARFDDVMAGLDECPKGFLHGEPYASNVLIDASADPPRICPIDWEMAGIGPQLIDLAALTAGNWDEDERDAIAGAYYEASDAASRLSRSRFTRSLACCHAAIAVQWLGWARGWVPPTEHRRDWGEELAMWLARL